MIAALYVQNGGSYYGLDGVEPPRIGTPAPFRNLLISMARSARRQEVSA